MLSPDDWNLGVEAKVVLTMYKMTGNQEKGWQGKVWVPNIWLHVHL